MIPRRLLTLCLCLCLGLGAMPGCSALTAVSGAAEKLDIYTLTPARPAPAQSNGRHLVVTPATASGALMTDRILVKPNRLQAQYLAAGRWADPAPVLVQSLLVASLQNSGAFRLVGRDDAGLIPDFTLLAELRDFQAEAPAGPDGTWTIRIGLAVTLIDESDRRVLAGRTFTQTAPAPSDQTLPLVNAFDTAMVQVLGQIVEWSIAAVR
jgi:cholesterol transport system auxiliary component